MSDSRHWVEFVNKKRGGPHAYAIIYDINSKRSKLVPIAAACPREGYARSFTPEGHFLIATQPASTIKIERQQIVTITEARVGRSIWPIRRLTVHLPYDLSLNTLIFSPHGDRIAWLLDSAIITSIHPYSSISLYISRLDGSEMKEAACVEGSSLSGRLLHWLPNDRQVSFIYKNALWVTSGE